MDCKSITIVIKGAFICILNDCFFIKMIYIFCNFRQQNIASPYQILQKRITFYCVYTTYFYLIINCHFTEYIIIYLQNFFYVIFLVFCSCNKVPYSQNIKIGQQYKLVYDAFDYISHKHPKKLTYQIRFRLCVMTRFLPRWKVFSGGISGLFTVAEEKS